MLLCVANWTSRFFPREWISVKLMSGSRTVFIHMIICVLCILIQYQVKKLSEKVWWGKVFKSPDHWKKLYASHIFCRKTWFKIGHRFSVAKNRSRWNMSILLLSAELIDQTLDHVYPPETCSYRDSSLPQRDLFVWSFYGIHEAIALTGWLIQDPRCLG